MNISLRPEILVLSVILTKAWFWRSPSSLLLDIANVFAVR